MNQLKAVLILVVCGLYFVAADDECKTDDYHVVEEDCSKFYRCASGKRYDFECPDGLKFNTNLQVCVHGHDLDCVALPRPSTEATPTTPKAPSPPTEECPNGDGHFVDEKDCTHFYICNDGARKYSTCDHGLHFDTTSKTCSDPATAKCTN